MSSTKVRSRPRRLRAWPAIVIVLLAAGAFGWVWLAPTNSRQTQVMKSMAVVAATLLLLALWLLAASRLGWRTRLVAAAALIGGGAFLLLSLEVREVSGDLVPHLAFKWQARPDQRLSHDLAAEVVKPDLRGADSPGDAGETGDFPQFLGPQRDATVPGIRLARDWQAAPPERLWQREIGAGNSGFAIVAGIAVTQEQRGPEEMVVAYDLRAGTPRWSYAAPTRHHSALSGDGPCATPAIGDATVYALGATGHLSALDLSTGALRWSRNVLADARATKPIYGLCVSPLLLDGQVIVVAGGSQGHALAAYDQQSGDERWSGGNYPAAYASPMVAELAGTRQLVIFHGRGPEGDLTGHALDGRPLWHASWPQVPHTSQPVLLPGDRLFVSSGYGIGAKVFHITHRPGAGFAAELVWESRRLKAKLTQVVYRQGFLYGLDDGVLTCLDAATGERRWKRGRYGHGQILRVDDLLLVLSEKGDVALVEAVPEAYHELGRFTAIEGRTWNTPALAGRYLVVRNPRQAAAYRLRLAGDL